MKAEHFPNPELHSKPVVCQQKNELFQVCMVNGLRYFD